MRISIAFITLALAVGPLFAEESAEGGPGKKFIVSDVQHYVNPRSVPGGWDAKDFKEQVYSPDFTASVGGVPAGTYTIEIEVAETYRTAPGRVMNISSGSTVLAKDLDVFQAAGGGDKLYKITGKVDYLGETAEGPLKIHFVGTGTDAFFNAIHIIDSQNQVVASVAAVDFVDLVVARASIVPIVTEPPIYNDPSQPLDNRIDDLIRRMSLNEKVHQIINDAPGIDRLGLPAYNYWSEALHGVAREGVATVFPQAIGLGAMWDTELEHQIGTIIGVEGRAKYNDNIRNNRHSYCQGLTFWSPNINIFRDPRWGRGQETYGEDPFLTSRMGVAFIEGLQGNDPKYMMAMACAKHFAVHSGPESLRHVFDAKVSNDDLYNTYLPQFEAAVSEAKVGGVMSAYNAINGVAAPADSFLLQENLRQKWGFDGYVVSDCDAVGDIWTGHHLAPDAESASADAVKGGTDLNCGSTYPALVKAVNRGLLTEADVDRALHHTLWTRFRLGLFDPPDQQPFNKILLSDVNSIDSQAIALKAAHESMVLLKNNGVLPLDITKLKQIAVLGTNATDTEMLHGNYNGDMDRPVSILDGIRNAVGSGIKVTSSSGCPLGLQKDDSFSEKSDEFQQAVKTAADADVIVYVGGLNFNMEGEEMTVHLVGFNGGDRTTIQLPEIQTKLIQALIATGKPVIFVNCSGSAIAIPGQLDGLAAMIQAWYPGEKGGTAVADVLFGKYNPAGRLPVTFYSSDADLPAFTDYNMANRTYRYFTGKPEFPFGFGLSYTKFDYSDLQVSPLVTATGTFEVTVKVTNSGKCDGEEVVQLYYKNGREYPSAPIRSLCAFQRVAIAHGDTKTVTLAIPAKNLRHWDDSQHNYVVDPGAYELQVGSFAGDVRVTGAIQVQ